MGTEVSEECHAFASFRLYPKRRALLHDGEQVAIGGRAFDMLHLLVLQAGTVVSVSDLMSFVWGNIKVEEANVRVHMGILRKALSRCREAQRAIETVPLRGYCFVLPVQHDMDGIGSERLRPQRQTNVPILLNPVVGRDDAIAVIGAALEERQLLTITGPGGIGKTTVAIATANHHARRFQGAITFVDLSQTSDGEEAAEAIAEALGLDVQRCALEELCEHLRTRASLLILDTCEHIVEAIARLAETLLAHCANLTLLATSREALRANGEWIHRLPSLTSPEQGEEINEENVASFSAITLFIERLRSTMRFEIKKRDLPVIAEICRRLDGIPLALEFAVARVVDLGLRDIAANLDDRFKILTRGRRTALPRHRTLSAAIDWSYSLLSDDEQRMLRNLASISGAFTAEHAIAVGGDAGCERPPEALSGLYEKSLLSVDLKNDAPIYRLLDTVRVYFANEPSVADKRVHLVTH
jgi:predicted ATPase/DNA-binding winged helix-turn-helix (wHTH) protein